METPSLELELEGTIFLVEKDENGVVLSKEPINGEAVLKMMISMLPMLLQT